MSTTDNTIARRYVELALAIDQHSAGYIDAYFGPAAWKEQAKARGPRPLNELLDQAADLAAMIAESAALDSQRRQFLTLQTKAMQTTLRILQGERLAFAEEVKWLYDITPEWIPESVFDEAHQILDELLPKGSSLPDRLISRNKANEISAGKVKTLLPFIVEHLRSLTHRRFPLPPAESLEIELVSNQPWSGYNWYLGHCRSRVEINTDLPLHINDLTDLIAHEGYPGHHTEHSNKESRLLNQEQRDEHCLMLINAPSCVISEGIASRALDVLMTDEEQVSWHARVLFPRAGLNYLDAAKEHAIDQARKKLRGVSGNAAFLLHERGADAKEAMAYCQRYALVTEEEARKRVEFISHPLYRSYIFTYYYGGAILDTLLSENANRDKWFTRLLTEPVTPSQIRLWNPSLG